MADFKRTIEVLITSRNQSGPGFKSASEEAKAFSSIVSKLSAGLVGGGVGLLSSLASVTIGAARSADEIRDLGQRSGLTATEVSRLKYVAEQSGTSVESLADAARYLNRTAYEARTGSKEAAAGFKDLGVKVTDASGKLKPANQLFLETVDALSQVQEEQRRASLSAQLLGRGSGDMAEFLKLGRDQIVAMSEEADRLSATLDPLAADAADLFGDRVSSAKSAAGGLAQTVSSALLPRLSDLVGGLTDVVAKTTEFVKKNPELVQTATDVGAAAVGVGAALGVVSNLATITSGIIDTLKDGKAAITGFFGFITSGAGIATLAVVALAATVGALLLAIKAAKEEAKIGDKATQRLKSDPDAARLQAVIDNPKSSYEAKLDAAQKLKAIVDRIDKDIRYGDLPTSLDRALEVKKRGSLGRVGYGGEPAEPLSGSGGSGTPLSEEALKLQQEIELYGRLGRARRDAERADAEFSKLSSIATDAARLGAFPGEPGPSGTSPERTSGPPFTQGAPDQVPTFAERLAGSATTALEQVSPLADQIIGKMMSLGDVIGNSLVNGFKDLGAAIGQWMKQTLASFAAVTVKALFLAGILSLLGLGGGKSFGTLFKGGLGLPHMASGGIVRGGIAGQDSVLTALMPGEAVIPAPLTAQLQNALISRTAAPAATHVTQITMPVQYYFGRDTDAREAALQIKRRLDELNRGTTL